MFKVGLPDSLDEALSEVLNRTLLGVPAPLRDKTKLVHVDIENLSLLRVPDRVVSKLGDSVPQGSTFWKRQVT